jgi:hypothetical protein
LIGASPWQRYWSKALDFYIYFIFLVLIATPIGIISEDTNPLLMSVALLPVSIMIDAFIIANFGNSVGRALIGIRVEKVDGDELALNQALSRGLRVYFFGMGMGVPLVSFFTYLRNLKKLEKKRVTSWDEALDTNVYQTSNTPARTWVTALLAVAIALGLMSLNTGDTAGLKTYGKAMVREISPSAMAMDRGNSKSEMPDAEDPIPAILAEALKDLKKELPKTIDPITTLIDVSVEGRTINYEYKVSRRDGDDEELHANLSDDLANHLCANQDNFDLMRYYEIIFRSRYRMPNSDAPLVIDTSYKVCQAQGIRP